MKTIAKRFLLVFSFLLRAVAIFASPGLYGDPGAPGVTVPLDGGILLSLLGGGGLIAAIFIKKKKK
jgi:hypothetical protein